MLYHEVLEKATSEDITTFIAHRNLEVREEQRAEKKRTARMKSAASRGRR